MNSNCENMKDQIADLLMGIVPEAQVQELQQHLNECAACRDYAQALKNEDMLLTEFFAGMDMDTASRQERLLEAIDHSSLSRQTDTLSIRRTIMKSPILKLAAAAAVIALVVLGLFELTGTESTSGVVWGNVARKIENSRGVIYRNKSAHSGQPTDTDYSIVYLSDKYSRDDSYKSEQIIRTSFCDFNTQTFTWIAHDTGKYMQETMSEETLREQHGAWANPKRWITEFLSRNHRKLGRKTIDGVLCEGLETTDPTFGVSNFQVDSLLARIWVSVETEYPVMLEAEITGGGDKKMQITGLLDQFQWDVELDPSIFEPNIPHDYEQIQ